MLLEIDVRVVPPVTTVKDPDDLKSFRVVILTADHVWVERAALASAVGAPTDPAWAAAVDEMIAGVARFGWAREDGAVRGHVEHVLQGGSADA